MSITIHFGGELQSKEKLAELLSFTMYFADEKGLFALMIEEGDTPLVKMKDEKMADDGTLYSGMMLQPHMDAETICLFFDEHLILDTFCKTQFGGAEAHLMVIEFLDEIKPFFKTFWVDDEGDYWETRDLVLLQKKLDMVSEILDGVEKSLNEQHSSKKWKYN